MTENARTFESEIELPACEIAERPADAPGPEQIAPFLLGCHRGGGALCLPLRPEGREIVEAFVAAERLCCPGIGWSVAAMGGGVALIVQGTPAELDVIEAMLKA